MKSFIQYLQEAGFNRAVNSGDPALMQKELQKRKARMQYYRDEQARLNALPNFRGAGEAEARRQQAEDLKDGIRDLDMPLSAMGIKTGTKLSELPSEMPWDEGPLPLDPNEYDLRTDKNLTADAEEVTIGIRKKIRGI
jgi:hypothetical protein